MNPFERMSVADKLKYMIMAVCWISLIGVTLCYMVSDFLIHRRSAVEHLKGVARILGTNVSAAVVFHDPVTAKSMMAALKNESDIHYSALYDSGGNFIAAFDRGKAGAQFQGVLPSCFSANAEPLEPDYRFQGSFMEFFSPIFYDGEYIGCIYIRSGLDSFYARFRRNVIIMSAVLLLALLGAYALSMRLQGLISGPIILLSVIMGRVSREKNYSLRAPTRPHDEIGLLMSGFNHMLSQIEERDRRLALHQEELETQVEERTAALRAANSVLQEALEMANQVRQTAEEASLAKGAALRELKETQLQLVQAAKLASIGELAAGVAHELNQPLMVIRGGVQVIARSIPKGRMTLEIVGRQMETLEKNTTRMMHIIDHLRTFSRQSPRTFVRVNVEETVKEALSLTKQQLRNRNIEVRTRFFESLPLIRGNPNPLEQVFLNLITNARDAIQARESEQSPFPGKIAVTARPVGEKEEWVEILFRDNGSGISPAIQEKIFDPFFTTKEVGKGTGLGLSISYGIIRDHGGKIEILGSSEEGTTIRILLPVRPDRPQKTRKKGNSNE